jgi:hypothetical protein
MNLPKLSSWYTRGAIVAVCLGAVGVVKYGLRWKDDNKVEELAEYVIKEETGADLDLTPNTPEYDTTTTYTTKLGDYEKLPVEKGTI